jgi:hypothetical protein
MTQLDASQQAFLALVRAGLWERSSQLLPYGEMDLGAVSRLAEEQAVLGLVAAGLEHVSDVVLPKEEVLVFVGSVLPLEQRNIEMNALVAQLFDRLREAGTNPVLVKGQGIAQCYERPLWRASGDVDLSLCGDDYEKAKSLLLPQAVHVSSEYTSFKHVGLNLAGGFEVEIHGTQHTRLSRRVDGMIDDVQREIFYDGKVRPWMDGDTRVLLPAPDEDVIIVFTHILHHFFFEGIGLRQICDWCRLLWKYRSGIDVKLLENRLRAARLMTEWKAFAALAVDWLGMPVEAMPLYSADARWSRKGARIVSDVLKVGNFGHNRKPSTHRPQPYLRRKFRSFWARLGSMLRHFLIFPRDSVFFIGGMLRTGLHAAVRGE